MQNREKIICDYFSAPSDCFWQWQDDGDAIGWRDGKLIAFDQEVTFVLKHLAPRGLPRLGALLLLIAATRKNWAIDNAEAGQLLGMLEANSYRDNKQRTSDQELLQSVLAGLQQVRLLDSTLRTSLEAKAALAEIVFDQCKPAVDAQDAFHVADAIRIGLQSRLAASNQLVLSGYGTIQLLLDLADLSKGLDRVTPESVRLHMETGIDSFPEPADLDEEPEEQLPTSDLARSVIQDLLDSPEHSGLAKLAKQLLATTSLPRKLTETHQQEVGGYSDIANRGTPDRLLLSELAQDGLTLAVRVAMNEAMYLHRETPPSSPRLRRELLIDTGVRSWGISRIFSTSVALALAANTPHGASFGAWRGSHADLKEIDLCSTEGLINQLAALEPDPHLAQALPRFSSIVAESEDPVEAIVLTSAEALADPEFKQSLSELVAEKVYLASIDTQGELRITERGMRGEKLIRTARLSLDELISDSKSVKDTRLLERMPAICHVTPFPLWLPAPIQGKGFKTWSVGNWGVLTVTGDGRILRWTDSRKGAVQLCDHLPKGQLWWVSPTCQQGEVQFIFGTASKPVLYRLNIYGRLLESTLLKCPPPTGFTFHNGVFFCIQTFGVTVVNPETGEAGRQLTVPSDLKWMGGRYFVSKSTNAWNALSFDGHSATIDRLPSFDVVNDPVILVWDAIGFNEPLAITKSGRLLSSEADRSKLPNFYPGISNCRVVDISSDGTRVMLIGDHRGRLTSFHLRLDSSPHMKMGYKQELDERIAYLARPISIRKKFKSIGVTEEGQLALVANKSIVVFDLQGGPTLRQKSHSKPLVAIEEFQEAEQFGDFRPRLSIARWPSGDQAILDSRGLLHLQPSSEEISEMTFVLAEGELTGWRDDGKVFGKSYFFAEGEEPTPRVRNNGFYQLTVARFVESICASY